MSNVKLALPQYRNDKVQFQLDPGAKISFKPGEMHMTIVGLKQPLLERQIFPLTLGFEKADNIEGTVPVEKVGAKQDENMGSMKK